MKPRILLAVNTKKEYYIEAVAACGGIPEARYCPEPDLSYDGLILCGGNDIQPSYYGEGEAGALNFDVARDEAEVRLAKAYLAAGKPILGVCRGHQLLNVMLGGSLHQHIAEAAAHTPTPDNSRVHPARAVEGSLLYRLYGEEFVVSSSHHQAVKTLGEGFFATAFAGNVIEGIEHKTRPLLGVQFHPEWMCGSTWRKNTADGALLFAHFLSLCRK